MRCDLLELFHFLGKKWAFALFTNIDEEPQGYNELDEKTNKKLNPTLLSNRLKEMQRFGIIDRVEEGNRVSYSITPAGKELKQILFQLKKWSMSSGLHIPDGCRRKDCVCRKVFEA